MTKVIAISYRTLLRNRERVFAILIGAIVLSAIAYGFLLKKAVTNIVEREKIVSEAKKQNADIGDLEAKYFSMKNSITLNLAYSKGFKDPSNVSYISKKSLTAMAAKNEL